MVVNVIDAVPCSPHKTSVKPLQPFFNQRFVEEACIVWVLNYVENGYSDNSTDDFFVLRRISEAFRYLVLIVQFNIHWGVPVRIFHVF